MNYSWPLVASRLCQRSLSAALWLVAMAAPAWAGLTVNGNATVTDSSTSLVWDQCPYGLSGATCTTGAAFYVAWAGALDAAVAANAASYKGFADWRLPNVNELESITKIDSYTAGQPAIDTTAFPGTPLDGFWTSTAHASLLLDARVVNFGAGVVGTDLKYQFDYVRLVRNGQPFASFDVLAPASADLSTTKTDGVTTAVPGGSVTYTITASNAGPSAVTGATVADTFPASLTATWTCVGAAGGTCAASGSGNLNDSTVNLPVGASVNYTVSAAVSPATTGTLSNTATVSSAIADPNPANNSATDTDTLTPQADLSITKTDGVASVTPGGSVTYTIIASNAGPSNAPGSTVADTLPAALTSASWTCVGAGGGTCAASGSGNISGTVNLPAGASVTYTLTATLSGAATGTLSNTATVTAAGGITDLNPANNSATDTDTVTVAAVADLAITVTDAPDPVIAGANLSYRITVGNAGPSAAATASWSDTLPAGTTFVSLNTVAGWSCTTPAIGSNGTVACNKASLASAGSAGFSLVVAVAPATPAGTILTNTVTVSSSTSDPTPGNNSATTTTTVTVNIIDPPPPEVTIPLLSISPACGLVAWPLIVNLSAGEGPAFAADMVAILSNVLGMPLRWVEQTAACGSVVLSGYNGGNLAFTPYGFLSGDGRPNGIYPVGNGQYHLVRNGQQLTLAPALVHLEQLAALLPGVAATQLDSGALSADVNGVRYVLQPGIGVHLGAASGSAQLPLGGDGYFHFVDALGNEQVLYPAFAEPATLRSILQGMDFRATVNIALDGTATIDFNGQRYTLVPDLTLAPVPAEHAGQDWWQESDTRYRVVNWQSLPLRSVSQGFTVRP